ncbi:MAG TPA: outer membrane protein assembly factor BamE [Pseudomonadota bacterium]|nr:outer membrane protein assembly factor BamE [Rhodanobacteraceae bacterium]MBP9153785.1 outer membrane protein assembly factor BamE [Xanthomonadales bacterium]HQW82188.1 outer membrane protein assembly factor BamE [Pseudomonadota bacterium]
MLRIVLLLALTLLNGCALIYKMDMRQGNIVDQKMVDQLKPGMTMRQVELVMGTPQVASPFNQERWEYVTSNSHRRKKPEIKALTLHFESGTLSKIEGDWLPKSGDDLLEESKDLQRNIPEDNRKIKNG